mgnify:CR=1 FL=1
MVTPTVPTPMTWKPPSSLVLKYGFVKLTSLNNSKSNTWVLFPDITWVRDESDTANPTLYPRVRDSGGLIRAIVWPDPVDVSEIQSGINLLDLKKDSDSLIVSLSILTIKYVKFENNGFAGLDDL